MNFSIRHLLSLLIVSLIVAIILCQLVSQHLGKKLMVDMRSLETDALFGAIEAGPVAIARMQAGQIAKEQLDRLMAQKLLSGRGYVSAEILGGPHKAYTYALWQDPKLTNTNCILIETRKFSYSDSMNALYVNLGLDQCVRLKENDSIQEILGFGVFLAFLFSGISLGLVALPVVRALATTFRLLAANPDLNDIQKIAFVPLRDIAMKAASAVNLERDEAKFRLASQVAHDIRSPLAALDAVLEGAYQLPQYQRELVRNASNRIRQIANALLTRNKALPSIQDSDLIAIPIAAFALQIIEEKKAQYYARSSISFDFLLKAPMVSSKIDERELMRALSNLLDNAAEATEEGTICLSLFADDEFTFIEVIDKGKGIPDEILGQLGEIGMSFGKEGQSGSGLGLYHARRLIEAAHGSFQIESKINFGTTIRLKLPREHPNWLASQIRVNSGKIVILDDDTAVHELWRKRFSSENIAGLDLIFFSKIGDFSDWVSKYAHLANLFLLDFNLDLVARTGIDVALRSLILALVVS